MHFNRAVLIISGAIILLLAVGVFSVLTHKNISIVGIDRFEETKIEGSSIIGLPCDRAENRIIAVMIASDKIARPLSGIAAADIVFEMPVSPDGITRMMAGYQCDVPTEIGSVRSAREDFLPLAAGLKSIFAHWGGEQATLNKLNTGILNNFDALINKYGEFFRKSSVPQPHNGFTSIDRLEKAAGQKGYDRKDSFAGYPHSTARPSRNISNIADSVIINYVAPHDVSWRYDEATNTYLRSRNGTPEIDKLTGKQVSASIVVVMKTTSRLDYSQYIRVATQGRGDASIYQNGIVLGASWSKDTATLDSKLMFLDGGGREVSFTPGKIWVEIIAEN